MNDKRVKIRELIPENDLEKKLARICSGRTPFLKGFGFFLNSLVVLLLKAPENGQSPRGNPFTLRGAEGEPLLAIFSSGARAGGFMKRHAAYKTISALPAWQVISDLPPDRGIIINPGWSVGFTIDPDHLSKLRTRFKLEKK